MGDPTPEEVLSVAATNSGRNSVTRSEIVRLLQAVLPATVALHNTRTGEDVESPHEYSYARTKVKKFPSLLVGVASSFTQRVPRVNFRVTTATLYFLNARIEIGQQLDDLHDLAELAQLVMKRTQSSWCLPDGRKLWNSCVPQDIAELPADYREYAGCAVKLQIDQMGIDLWTPPAP